ncbi:MAG TPA: heavy metal translocating P-type ATPase, partial [Thermoplasmata archaeon]|nr:heavy metal translocating P-type ATPase [Thermoplasmata archaeon]
VVEAESSQVPLQRTADRIAQRFVPFVLVLAGAAALAWFVLGAGFTIAVLVFVSVAITACPCAFGLATPAALLVGTGRAAEEGVLFRGKDAIERTARIDTVLTDKTGTLTRGRPALTELAPAAGVSRDDLLRLAAGLEKDSRHPLSRAVREAAQSSGVTPEPLVDLHEEPGQGILARRGAESVSVHRGDLSRLSGAGNEPLRSEASRMEAAGTSWSIVSVGNRAVGLLGFSDPASEGARAAVRALTSEGIQVVMATGDHPAAAHSVAEAVGIQEVHAGLSPAAKLDLLRSLQAKGRRVAFVGDGINDAPALLAADVGIAIGAGTDVAKESGHIILVRSDFAGVPLALGAGRRTVRKVRQNLFWAIGYNSVLLPVAAGVLVPVFGLGLFTVLPIVGALAMGLSSTSVLLNSLSLRAQIQPVGVVVEKP